ncbi:MAG: hypothetical protein H0V82_07675 [Candidatus Protochlamydia sp.]|nr:hypothetical protein [Candidatus Protochlamydia sp.]
MDPILEDELKRSRIMKQYQQYQAYTDQVDEAENLNKLVPEGELQGKKVNKITSENSQIEHIFNSIVKK